MLRKIINKYTAEQRVEFLERKVGILEFKINVLTSKDNKEELKAKR